MTNSKLTTVYKEFVNKMSGKLRAFRAAACLILLLLTYTTCTKSNIPQSSVCPDGDCNASIVFPEEADVNGYHHVILDWTKEYYPYFSVDVEADPTSEEYHYNGDPVVTALFDSDTSWIIGDTLVLKQAYYKPFTEEWTSTGGALPAEWRNLDLTQFTGTVVNIAQNTRIYFKEEGSKVTSRRVLGPFAPHLRGDTITVYMEVMWDAGVNSVIKSDYLEKFIVE